MFRHFIRKIILCGTVLVWRESSQVYMAGHQATSPVSLLSRIVLLFAACAFGQFHTSSTYSKSVCQPIPYDLKLCRGMDYNKTRLPNLLNHETMKEVHQQANSWVPLLPKKCHPDLQLFLCSVYVPVCVQDAPVPIYPCRSLCETVRDACTPVMERAGYPWPSMLDCKQFPQNPMCIDIQCGSDCPSPDLEGEVQASNRNVQPNTSAKAIPDSTAPQTCSPCDHALEEESIIASFCALEFVMKVKIRTIKTTKKDQKLYTERRRRQIYKQGPLRKKDLRKLTLVIQGGAECPCPQLDVKKQSKKRKKKDFFLVMGHKVDRKLLVTVLHRWPKKQKVLRKVSKQFEEKTCLLRT